MVAKLSPPRCVTHFFEHHGERRVQFLGLLCLTCAILGILFLLRMTGQSLHIFEGGATNENTTIFRASLFDMCHFVNFVSPANDWAVFTQ